MRALAKRRASKMVRSATRIRIMTRPTSRPSRFSVRDQIEVSPRKLELDEAALMRLLSGGRQDRHGEGLRGWLKEHDPKARYPRPLHRRGTDEGAWPCVTVARTRASCAQKARSQRCE